MISLQTVEVFIKYDGESDYFVRAATAQEGLLLSSSTAKEIEEIILHMSLANSGKASSAYAAEAAGLVGPSNIEPLALQLLAQYVARKHSTPRA